MIDRSHALSITRQAQAAGISRGSVYYLPRPVSDADLALMRRQKTTLRRDRTVCVGANSFHTARSGSGQPPGLDQNQRTGRALQNA